MNDHDQHRDRDGPRDRRDWMSWFQFVFEDLVRRPRSMRAAGQFAQDIMVGLARLTIALVSAAIVLWAALGRR